jgi:hypothetical protein
MGPLERPEHVPPAEPEKPAELIWLEENLPIFGAAAQVGYEQAGRGAIFINLNPEMDWEKTQFQYTDQSLIPVGEDEVSQHLVQLVAEYDPEKEFVAVIIKPDKQVQTFQYALAEATNAELSADTRPPAFTGSKAETPLEPPDLETLMEWAEEGGCEAACSYGCWVEPDGVCEHGKPSWLLQLGLI